MTDSELLEGAALAMQVAGDPNFANFTVCTNNTVCLDLGCRPGAITSYWKPLDDDGDVMRMAVKLELFDYIEVRSQISAAYDAPDPCKEVRRTLVLAAANIGIALLNQQKKVPR